jgi:formate-dependent phosphoribosylglycinamide formyltransferase (GAR transformylase)
MKNVLLVDTNFSSAPIQKYLSNCGYDVYTIGNNENDALTKHDRYLQVDYSNLDKINDVINVYNINYLVPGCNDLSYKICSEVNINGNFSGIDTKENTYSLFNKEKFRGLAELHNLPTPKLFRKEHNINKLPIIIKPVDSYSGHGITVIEEMDDAKLELAIQVASQASQSKQYIIEEFVSGQLYSHSAFVQDGKIIIDFIVEEHCTVNPYVVDTSRIAHHFPQTITKSIRANIEVLTQKLALNDGLIHTQFIFNGTQYWLIEITRRCPGDLYSQLIELSTGFNYVENYIRPFLKLPFNVKDKTEKKWVMRHTITQNYEYLINSISFNLPFKLLKYISLSLTGAKLPPAPYGRAGIIYAEASTEEELNAIFSMTLNKKLYQIQ